MLRGVEDAQITKDRSPFRGELERTTATSLVMSDPGLARSAGGHLSRAGRCSRVAGAHLAVPNIDGVDAGPRLVPGTLK